MSDHTNEFVRTHAPRFGEWLNGREEIDLRSVEGRVQRGGAMRPEGRAVLRGRASRDRGLACRLPIQEQERQREEVAAGLYTEVEEVREIEDGYAFRFPSDDRWVRSLTEFMLSERECCPFYRFELVLEAGDGAAWLHLRGGRDVKRFTREEFLELVSE